MPHTNATIRHFSRARRPVDDQRVTISNYRESDARRAFVDAAVPGLHTPILFMRAHPNPTWVRVTPSTSKPGKFVIERTSWLVPDAGVIEDAEEKVRQAENNAGMHQIC